jgi:hypothetical protein
MGDRTQLDREIHNLLDRANARLLVGVINVASAKALIIRLRDCADKARNAKLTESANRLRDAADAIEKKLQNGPSP